MENPILDKIIGSSAITPNTISVHRSSGAIAFAAQGCVSIILPSSGQRFDVKVSDRCQEITALAFSNDGHYLAVGEAGPDAKIVIISFSSSFDRVNSRVEIVTKENGFSALAFNSKAGVLVSVGTDAHPMFILWDVTQPVAVAVGYYKLPRVPNRVVLTSDCSMAIVAGQALLKFVQTQVEKSPKPVLLKTRVANIQQYVMSNFVDVCCSSSMPATVYAITDDGVLCYFESVTSLFQSKSRKGPPLVLTPIRLKRGEMTGLAFDDQSVFCASVNGSLIEVRKDGNRHRVSGRYSAIEARIVGVGVSDDVIVAAFDDGHIVFWQTSQPGSPAFFVLSQHRGPVCGMATSNDQSLLVTCGSDETVRVWEIHRGEKLISKSSQEEKAERRFNSVSSGYMENLTGIRCVTYADDLIVAGGHDGRLHVLDGELNELQSFDCKNGSVMCLASHAGESTLACGFESGTVSLYEISGKQLTHKANIPVTRTPLKSLAICRGTLAAASSLGVTFVKLADGKIMGTYTATDPVLELDSIDRAGLFAAVGCDHCIEFFTAEEGKLFRKHQLSLNNFPLAIAVHKSGLLIATAMSSGNLLLIDPMSGNSVCGFPALTEMITSMVFQGDDLVVSTFGGSVMIWKLPAELSKELECKPASSAPAFLSFLQPSQDESEDKELDNHILEAISCSVMSSRKSMANWTFREDQDAVEAQEPVVNDGEKDENTDPDQPADIDDERQPAPDAEKKVMDFVRNSMLGSKKGNWFSELVDKEKQGTEEEELIELRLPPDRPKRKLPGIDKLVEDAPEMPKIKPIEMEVYDSLFDEVDGAQSPTPEKTKESPLTQKEPTLAERIKSTTSELRSVLTLVEALKTKQFDTEAEKQAQAKILALLATLDTEKSKREAKRQLLNSHIDRVRASLLETNRQIEQTQKLVDALTHLD